MIPLIFFIGALCSCHAPGLIKSSGEPYHSAVVATMDDVERHNGEFVKIIGRFEEIGGTNGRMTTDAGLTVFLPHLDEFFRGTAWHAHQGKRAIAIGRLRKVTGAETNRTGASLLIQYFRVVDERGG